MALPIIPGIITPGQAKAFADSIVEYLNGKLDLELKTEDVNKAELSTGRATVWIQSGGDAKSHQWGKYLTPERDYYHTTNNDLEQTIPWIEALGFDPNCVMRITLFGAYLQVEGFTQAGMGDWPTARILRHEGGAGYQKYTIDIPILLNGDSK